MNEPMPQILAILPAFIPSTTLCVVKPFLQLHHAKKIRLRVNLERKVNPSDVCWADLVVLCRNVDQRYSSILELLLRNKIPYIYDLDDNFYEIPANSEMGRYHQHPDRLAMLTKYLESASLVRVYSAPLADRVRELNRRVEIVSGPIDTNIIQNPNEPQNHGRLKIVFPTSRFDDELASIFMPALQRILDQYGDQVEMHFWGTMAKSMKGRRSAVFHPFIRNYDKFLRRFSKMGYEIGLAPLENDLFHRSKTNNKFREYGACRIAGIYSDVDVYSECVVNGETGLLVANKEDAWHDAIARLIKDKVLREKIKNQAKEQIQREYGQGKFDGIWLEQIRRVLEHHRPNKRPSSASLETASWVGQSERRREPHHFGTQWRHLMNHLQREGWHYSWSLVQQYIYDLWMLYKIRCLP